MNSALQKYNVLSAQSANNSATVKTMSDLIAETGNSILAMYNGTKGNITSLSSMFDVVTNKKQTMQA